MDAKKYIEMYNLTEEQWEYLSHAEIIEEIIEDKALMDSILQFSKNAITKNPFYKFFEIIHWVKDNDYVDITDLDTLDKYYKMHIVDYLLSPKGEYYTGVKAKDHDDLAKRIGVKNKNFTYDFFRQLIVNMY